MVPRGRTTSSPARSARSLPEHSIITPNVPLSAAKGFERVGIGATLTARSTPSPAAKASGSSTTSVTVISAAPWKRAAAATSAPIGPKPVISTRCPSSERRPRQGMQSDGEGLRHGEFAEAGPGPDLALHASQIEHVAEAALDMRHRHGAAVEAHVEALVRHAFEAIVAMRGRAATD